MYKYQPLSQPNTRIDVADILRAIAVIGIVLIHFLEHLNFYNFVPEPEGFWGKVGQGIWDVTFFLGSGKMYAIFALLFGLSFFIMHDNQAQKGVDFRWRFFWRMIILLVLFATINLAFYNGDILCVYAICGIMVIPFIRVSNKALLWIMLFLAIQPIEIWGIITGIVNPEAKPINLGSGSVWFQLMPVQEGTNFWAHAKVSILNGIKLNVGWAIENGRFTQTLALFLAGIWLGRKRMFYNEGENLKFWKKVCIVSVVFFVLVLVGQEFKANGRGLYPRSLSNMLSMWRNLAMTAFYVSGIVLLYYKTKCGSKMICLAPLGKMSLTHFISQSLIGSFLFYGWGLALYRYCNRTESFLLGVAVVALQWTFSYFWLKKHKRGPLEQIWHKLTWWPK